MPKLIVLYPPPANAEAFEAMYREEHAPLVRAQMPEVRRFVYGRVTSPSAGAAAFHWIAELYFETMDVLRAATSSAGGQRAAGHALEMSTGGMPTMIVVEDSRD